MRVLVVEDDARMAAVLEQGLREEGYQVVVCHDGREGLSGALTHDLDVIVLDVMLPGLDGMELTKRLRGRGFQTPVLMLTARDGAMDIIQGLNAGADDGQSGFSFTRLIVQDLVSGIRPQVENVTARKNLDLALHLPVEELPVIGDRGALRRLLLVLLDNAIKFTAAPGRVEVGAESTADHVVLEVRDTGGGISNHDLPRIFDRFYQADKSRSGGGVGLGLSIAQWIVKGHNGRIEVQSQPGQGSVFRVFLPAEPDK